MALCTNPRCANQSGNANCTGALMERNVSAMISIRDNAASTRAAGPVQAIQESFICGRAQTLLRPLSTKHRHSLSSVAKLTAAFGSRL